MDAEFRQDIERQVAGPMDTLLERLAEKVGAKAQVSTVFGDPVDREGVTVIPVAKAAWGFGGGGGSASPAAKGTAPEVTQGVEVESEAGEGPAGKGTGEGGPEAASGVGGGGGMAISPVGYIVIKDGEAEYRPIRDAAAYARLALAGSLAALAMMGTARLLRRG